MIGALLFTLFFVASGICISEVVFHKKCFADRLWLGLTLGLLLFTWLPPLFAFAIGFTKVAQLLSVVVALSSDAVCVFLLIRRKKANASARHSLRSEWKMLLITLPIIALGVCLLNTHVLYPHEDGSIWVGQVTYGDLAMHLGFITSIAEQAAFPPQYSIFPGHALNYPFLCETSGASLFQLGASARQAYLITAVYAFILVVFGIYRFMKQWLKKDSRTILATVLFFFGGGFGFFYFFDLAKSGGILQQLLGTTGQTVSQTLLDGFYQTPTNIPQIGLRWVNVIVDMLIPQRATLFGWAFLFPCLYLLHGFAFERRRENIVTLGIFAGLLPLIHTHSFLALGIISAVYCIGDLIHTRFEKKRLLAWLIYAGIACVLAAPQLIFFSFRQAAESSLVRFHLNWGNFTDSYLWFYIKNMGWIFLLMPFAFLVLPKRDRQIYCGVLALWLISEFLEFQPNDYDNNKLLFIWFAFTCAIDAKLICFLFSKAKRAVNKRSTAQQRLSADRLAISVLSIVFSVYLFCGIASAENGKVGIPSYAAFSLFFLAGLLTAFSIASIKHAKRRLNDMIIGFFSLVLPIVLVACLLIVWLKQYRQPTMQFHAILVLVLLVLSLSVLVMQIGRTIEIRRRKEIRQFSGGALACTIAAYLLIFSVTVSSVMTILRECKSEYQVYTASEAALAEQIREESDADAVILANSFHWNLVTPLTGRSIVTGTGTFLYYHGIDTTERAEAVKQMFENPFENLSLFETYNVRYVLISNAERMNYQIDHAFFREYGEVLAENEAGVFYKLKDLPF